MSAPDMQGPRLGPTSARGTTDWIVMLFLIPVVVVLLHDGVDRVYAELWPGDYYETYESVPWWLPMAVAPALGAVYGARRRVERGSIVLAALGGAAVAYAAFWIWPLVLLYFAR